MATGLLQLAEVTRDAIRSLGGTRCDTLGCQSPATSVIGFEGYADAVCGACRTSYCARPALRVRLAITL